jgi:hypothetical protein
LFERTKARALPMANQAADSAPVVVACCNACRVCVTSNVVGVILAGGAAAGALASRLVSRYLRRKATTSPSSEPT